MILEENKITKLVYDKTIGKEIVKKAKYEAGFWIIEICLFVSYFLTCLFVHHNIKYLFMTLIAVTFGLVLANNVGISLSMDKKSHDFELYKKKEIKEPTEHNEEYLQVTADWKPYPHGIMFTLSTKTDSYIKLNNPIHCKHIFDLVLKLGNKMAKEQKIKDFYKNILDNYLEDIVGWNICPMLSPEQYTKYYCVKSNAWIEWEDQLEELGYIKNYPFPLTFGNKEFIEDEINENIYSLPWNYQLFNISISVRHDIVTQDIDIDQYFNDRLYIKTDTYTDNHYGYLLYHIIKFFRYDQVLVEDKVIDVKNIVKGNQIFNYWQENPYEKWKQIYKDGRIFNSQYKEIELQDWIKPEWTEYNVSKPNKYYNPV